MNDSSTQPELIDVPTLPGYRLSKILGQGGMGRVYLAEDESLARHVAIKVLHVSNSDNNYAERILQEARTLAKLNHANVVQVHSVIEQPTPAIVMEYVPGITLKKYQLEHSLSLPQKLRLLYQIAQGLDAIHKHNIVHRDLKADNILLDTRDSQNVIAKLTDFGIASVDAATTESHLSDKVRGSLPWMSPEQLQNQPVKTASDLFSFGLLAFQLLAGKHAFASHSSVNLIETPTANTAAEIANDIVNGNAMDANHITPALPQELAHLLNQLLHKTARQRPTAKQTCDQLQQLLRMLEQQDILGMKTQTIETLPIAKKKKTYTLPAIAAACVALISIAVVWFMMQPPPTRYVAVLKPQITETEPLSSLQKNLVLTSIEDALQQLIISTPHLMLIPKSELDDTQSDIALIGKSTGADDIVAPELICNAQHCELVLSLYNQAKKNNTDEVKWHTTNRQQNPIYLESYQPIYQFAQTQLTNLYSGISELNAKSLVISEEDYAEYLEIYYRFYVEGQHTTTSLNSLKALIQENKYYYPIYSLYFDQVSEAYSNNSNEELLSDAIQIYDSVPSELQSLAQYLVDGFYLALEAENYGNAIVLLNEMKQTNMGEEKLSLLNASYFQKTGDYSKAINEYIKTINLRPSALSHYHLAINYWWQGDQEKALQSLLKAKDLNNLLSNVNTMIAAIYLQKGMLTETIQIYEEITAQTKSGISFTNLSVAHMLNKDYEMAVAYAHEALQFDKEHLGRMLNYADALTLSGEKEKGKTLYSNILRSTEGESDLLALSRKAQAYLRLNETEAALKVITEAKRVSPSNPNILFISSMILTQIRETQSALIDIEEAINQGLGKIWFYLPWFDSLCDIPKFQELTAFESETSPKRCIKS